MNQPKQPVEDGTTYDADTHVAVEDAAVDDTRPEADQAATVSPADDQTDIAALQQERDQAQAKADDNWNLYLRTQADLQNIQRRAERDLSNAHKFALEQFVKELLPVRDSLEMGIAAATETVDVVQLKEGSELTLKMLQSALEKFGVKTVDPTGSKFDPELHQAMAMQPTDQSEPNTVLQVVQKGYTLNERLVRPAMVIVARSPEKK